MFRPSTSETSVHISSLRQLGSGLALVIWEGASS